MKRVRESPRGARAFLRGAKAFPRGVWEFVVGDDPRTALGVAVALGFTALLSTTSIPAWWVMPVAVLLLLALSIRRAARRSIQARSKTSRAMNTP